MTGTPAGVGAIVAGDKVAGGIDGLGEIDITVGQRIVRHSRATDMPWSHMR
jgi:fumarylpyruvate hydrolase